MSNIPLRLINKQVHKTTIITVMIVLLLMTIILIVSCIPRETSTIELKEIQYLEDPAHFSFQYPVGYQVELFTSQARHGIITLAYYNQEDAWLNRLIDIQVYETTSTVEAVTSENISDLNDEFPNFHLIQKKIITLAGFKALQFICTFDPTSVSGVSKEGVKAAYEKEVVMVHNNVIWQISILSAKDQMKNSDLDFDQILQTFKILN